MNSNNEQVLVSFQYIPCYYSTEKNYFKKEWRTNFNTSYVIIQLRSKKISIGFSIISIHPMLLFNKLWKCRFLRSFHFNTSYVIIQPTKNRHSCILLISINHDLKPFFQHFTNHSIENQIFVRTHVFTLFDRLFQKITW